MHMHCQRGMQATKSFSYLFFFLVFSSLQSSFMFPAFLSTLCYTLNGGNNELPHYLIQDLCLRLSRSTPLGKTLMADHYLRIDYLQHYLLMNTAWLAMDPLKCTTGNAH